MTELLEAPLNQGLYANILYTPDAVQARIYEMASEVVRRYNQEHPVFVCLLRGGNPFASDLMKAIARIDPYYHPVTDYMTVRTYDQDRTDKPPELVMDVDPRRALKGKKVVLLDDTLDRGVTAEFAQDHLIANRGATSVDMVVLVEKERERTAYQHATLYGFKAPGDLWLTGMGLDDAQVAPEGNRWAGWIAASMPQAE